MSKLNRNEKIYTRFFDLSTEGCFILNQDRKILSLNNAAKKILGYTKRELTNAPLVKIVPEKYQEECAALCKFFFKGEKLGPNHTFTFRKKNKSQIVVRASISLDKHSVKDPLLVAFFSDITSSFKMQELLKYEHDLHEEVLERIGDAFISFDNYLNCTYINNNALYLFANGHEKGEMIGKNIWTIFPGIKGTSFEEKCLKVLNHLFSIVFEIEFKNAFGWLEIRICRHNTGIAIFARDISEAKERREQLRKSNERFSIFFHSSPVPLYISRFSDGKIIEVNESFLDMFGFRAHQVIGRAISELGLNTYEVIRGEEHLAGFKPEKNTLLNMEVTLRKESGVLMHVLFHSAVIELNGQDHSITTITDITPRKKVKKVLLRMNEFLEIKVRNKTFKLKQALDREKEINEMKTRFVSMASHEFRTPLASVLTSVSILEQFNLQMRDERFTKHLDRIKLSVDVLNEMLNDFLALEKIDEGKPELINTEFQLPKTIAEIVDEIRTSLKPGQVIHYQHTGKELVYLDKKSIRHVLINLLLNASKYSGDRSEIVLNTLVKTSLARFTVKDNGIGIPLADRDKIFTLFYRAKNAEHVSGTGLGLYIVKKYVDVIQGSIRFTSKLNKGTTFKVELPFSMP